MGQERKTGLIMEGGAMRGLFTSGVIDVMMENGITFDGAIGVSAGATFGCNIKSKQIGRAARYCAAYCNDDRFASLNSLIKTGDIYGVDFCYRELPQELDPFDFETFTNNPMEFYVVATDIETGKAVYHKCSDAGDNDMQWIRASASMPLVSRTVEIGGRKLLDGGMSDSIPAAGFEKLGFNHNVAILTQPLGYIKHKNEYMIPIKIKYRNYPNLVNAIANRHKKYNAQTTYIRKKELEGELFVIRPPKALEVGSVERDASEIMRVYEIGRRTMTERIEELKEYMGV
ncbi:MAG: patatin family protein [Lachnospiraceae bacterium]|nr:patatin family protein [Lachnospiraceae bacterium]